MTETLNDAAARLTLLKDELLFNENLTDGVLDSMACLEYLQALALIDAAARGMQKAALLQTKALAASPYRL